ncbi:1,4-alpha-glucan-branching enzyme [Paludibacter sp. 221]|uniref:alpha-amylase family glycosyl hydrolase n=1 Tax=Paludibacter sp. 221 TaxID=2302939 RepID=UPI0013D04B3D|nr:alpha amylase C-terminal domain-containing protein [Paludibacter sp. 221]NDV46370.1 1,4-alpha-glucan-branching enzyme [Paludibacter sp. 221]
MEILPIVQNDPYLKPYADAIYGRYEYYKYMEDKLTGGRQNLSDFATGYMYFGLHKTSEGWVFREWAPNATAIYLIGDFNGWKQQQDYALKKLTEGVWEIRLPHYAMAHGQYFKLYVEWQGGAGERIPAWATRVVQDENTKIFSAQVWDPIKPYTFKHPKFTPSKDPLLIYECHIGMSSNEEKVASYEEFRKNVLPRIAEGGYNCIQLMAIQEHPYYGSFGYHVSSFFAASSRFGTPEDLKRLIDEAHDMGISVIMDLVHSHAVKNETEGLGRFDGTPYQYFHGGDRREHPAWDSLLFDYAKPAVIHFLLSNCKFWLEEYKFDGFRFDGVTSMLYRSHGLGEDFTGYESYYNMNQDGDAICYLTLANKMIHQVNPNAITVAEEMSGMPGLANKIEDGGIGFDYRLAMGIPDFWIKYIKETKDENWKVGHIYWELTNRRAEEKTISYAESHDQALVGDKTIIFRLIDADMYWHMQKGDNTLLVDRGVALHKMIRLITSTTMNGGYLNFMGNEFGHPEWIDFPREGNGWSHKYARRQWELADNPNYLYYGLNKFDHSMMKLINSVSHFNLVPIQQLWDKEGDQVLAYQRGDLVFVFNFSGVNSYSDYGILADPGAYKIVLNTDNPVFDGFGLIDEDTIHFTQPEPKTLVEKEWLRLYIPARTAFVLKRQ